MHRAPPLASSWPASLPLPPPPPPPPPPSAYSWSSSPAAAAAAATHGHSGHHSGGGVSFRLKESNKPRWSAQPAQAGMAAAAAASSAGAEAFSAAASSSLALPASSAAAAAAIFSSSSLASRQPGKHSTKATHAARSSSASAAGAAASSSASSYGFCVSIGNIPHAMHSLDLRHFFSEAVAAGRFKVFQPCHRLDRKEATTEARRRVDHAIASEPLPHIFPSQLHAQVAAILHDSGNVVPAWRLSLLMMSRFGVSLYKTAPGGREWLNHQPTLFKRQRVVMNHKNTEIVQLTPEGAAAIATMKSAAAPAAAAASDSRKRRFESVAASAESPATSSTGPTAWKCVVQMRTRADADALVTEFDGKEWTDWKGEFLNTRARVRYLPLPRKLGVSSDTGAPARAPKSSDIIDLTDEPIDLTDEPAPSPNADSEYLSVDAAEAEVEAEILAAVEAGEFQTPQHLPQGIVGTPTATIMQHVNELPKSLLKRLKISMTQQALAGKQFGFKYAAAGGPDDDDDIEARYTQAANDEAQEEWDRDLAQGTRSTAWDSGRGLGKVNDQISYEEAVEQVWEKGGSGLVHYTDAAREQSGRGDLDEQCTDGWNVDADEEEEGMLDDVEEMRAMSREERQAKTRERAGVADALAEVAAFKAAAATKAAAHAASTAWTKSPFLTKMMSSMGWREGTGLGKRSEGIVEPIQPVNRGDDKAGLGRTSEATLADRVGKRQKKQQNQQPGSAEAFAQALNRKLKRSNGHQRKQVNQWRGGHLGQHIGAARPPGAGLAADARADFASSGHNANGSFAMPAASPHAFGSQQPQRFR